MPYLFLYLIIAPFRRRRGTIRSTNGEGYTTLHKEHLFIPRTPRIRRYKKSRWRKPSAFLVSSSPVLNAACPRRLCQPPWTQPSCKEPRPTLRRNQLQRIVPTQTPAALRERGVWGERRFSQRSGLSPQRPPTPRLFRREREGGGFSTEKPPPSQFFVISSRFQW